MTPAEIVAALTGHGFTQTDVARALGMMAKGSGSYVGAVAAGKKSGAQHLGPLRAMLEAVSGKAVPTGRQAAGERQAMLSAPEVQPVRRMDAKGRQAAVRKPSGAFHRTKAGHMSMKATAARQALLSGGKAIADAIDVLAGSGGRFSLLIVGHFPPGSQAARSQDPKYTPSNFRPRYRKRARNATLRKGSRNVFEGTFANKGYGFEARDWQARIAQAGSFVGALEMWASATAQIELPTRLDRVELSGTPRPEPWKAT